MEVFEAIRGRRSIRTFERKNIPKEVIEEIVDAGRWAPSGNDVQPWEFVVITKQETREAIARLTDYGKFIAQAPVCVVVLCRDTKYYLEDGCAATQNILLAATARGVASCWVAGDKKPYCGAIKRLLGVPEQYKVVSLIALGYSKRFMFPKRKRDLSEVLHWERF